MDLFLVNRFLGDQVDDANEEDEAANLRKLLANIEERKKLRTRSKEESTLASSKDVSTPVKSSIGADAQEDRGTDAQGDRGESPSGGTLPIESTGRKRKKKRKIKESSSDEDEIVPEASVQEDGKKVAGEGFTILGTEHFLKKSKVKRVLPHWLANPCVVSVNLKQLSTTVDSLPGIDTDMIKKLQSNDITHFFPVQCQVIPWLLSSIGKQSQYWPRDVCVSAPTGSGKTLAYVIPIVQALNARVVCRVRALIVLPVQDLAVQVAKVFNTYCEGTNLRVALITGNSKFVDEQNQLIRTSLASDPQSRVDIIVSTTGRIVDHLQFTPGFTLQHLRYLVIDEADRIMENIKNDWLYHLNKHVDSLSGPRHLNVASLQALPQPPQKLLFSATLSQDPEKLQQLGLFQPILFTSVMDGQVTSVESSGRGDFVGKYTTPAELQEKVCMVSQADKPLVLYHLMAVQKMKNVLCFTDSQVQAHRLAILLKILGEGQFLVAEISAALNRREREAILKQFADGTVDILVCTDSLARGMDLPLVDLVVSYNAPKFIKSYIHRAGRTARAGKPGTSVTLVQNQQRTAFQRMLSNAGKSLAADLVVQVDEFADRYQLALEAMKEQLQAEQSSLMEKCKMERRSRKPKRRQKPRNKRFSSSLENIQETAS